MGFKEVPSKKTSGFIDYYWMFECASGPGNLETNKGRAFTVTVYGNALNNNVTEAAKTLVNITTALLDVSEDDIRDQEIDFTKLIGNSVWCLIKDEVYEGRILKKPEAFTPDETIPF